MAGENITLANSQLIMDEEPFTPIQKFYDNCNIFITGGTGFLGKSRWKIVTRTHTHTHAVKVNLFKLNVFVDYAPLPFESHSFLLLKLNSFINVYLLQ